MSSEGHRYGNFFHLHVSSSLSPLSFFLSFFLFRVSFLFFLNETPTTIPDINLNRGHFSSHVRQSGVYKFVYHLLTCLFLHRSSCRHSWSDCQQFIRQLSAKCVAPTVRKPCHRAECLGQTYNLTKTEHFDLPACSVGGH